MLASDSETNIRMSRGTGLITEASQGLSRPFLKTFAAVYPDPTDRPWVYDGKKPNFTFHGGRKQATAKVSFSF